MTMKDRAKKVLEDSGDLKEDLLSSKRSLNLWCHNCCTSQDFNGRTKGNDWFRRNNISKVVNFVLFSKLFDK